MSVEQTRTKWGYAKFGTGRVPAAAIAVPCGLALGAAGGWLSVLAGISGSNPALSFCVFAACIAMPAVALVYVLVVDRNTLIGATERPDDSVESGWIDKAAAASFMDLILVLGVAATVLAFIPKDFSVDLKLILPAVIALGFASFGIRYLVLRRKG
ncbi:hypothetical protein [Arthrobacter sp. zg-Y1171]|uniref:hypothetical protein n=1 Tax=Arthrobacter sp. zg-Y1171 TaxID=2964610 RepID=UPI0021044268|nr:hypothetical protein [Arthrobacter sp. zg-Y1171]MCQ1995765.1 hypothetical protein [Arthrobacter sp. zg-Y1171]UWX83154.1 hypothetical protein N2L00_07075 [Arthrobacter sp. zg-Y1171]